MTTFASNQSFFHLEQLNDNLKIGFTKLKYRVHNLITYCLRLWKVHSNIFNILFLIWLQGESNYLKFLECFRTSLFTSNCASGKQTQKAESLPYWNCVHNYRQIHREINKLLKIIVLGFAPIQYLVFLFLKQIYFLRYYNFEPCFKLRWCRARNLFESQVPVTTGGFKLRISCMWSSYLTY